MAKFGLFDPSQSDPIQVWTGDYMSLKKPYVTIYTHSTNPSLLDTEITTIRLKPGFYAQKLES
jgi:hypothetical protein